MRGTLLIKIPFFVSVDGNRNLVVHLFQWLNQIFEHSRFLSVRLKYIIPPKNGNKFQTLLIFVFLNLAFDGFLATEVTEIAEKKNSFSQSFLYSVVSVATLNFLNVKIVDVGYINAYSSLFSLASSCSIFSRRRISQTEAPMAKGSKMY